ncbi:rhomboid family intramembrane serine protease [Alkalicoccus daliensis]|uniref:Rhomboid family peptidase. Serine peptidase. MEROPS family S54 n=1 Tax=Alkalicoccus daliensis TaxID=745820 RepID=A0A1H0B804_9BACI|nr:rhomboid family intramembrane serine protease [Alkalicoccus daliensis]SDN41774.1 rhomboid family peptidase. Serine peptidase. MEROPS family S54 [Alkalicoccus daliensis]
MDHLKAEIRFWETLHHLIKKEDMKVIHINEEGKIVWLEDDRFKNSNLIRLHLRSYDWSSQLRNDINRAHESAKSIRKKMKMRDANVTNVIFAPFTPVDSYEDEVSQPLPFTAGGKRQMRSIIIPMENLYENFFPLATEWKLHDMPSYVPEYQLEDEEQSEQLCRTLKHMVERSYHKRREEERNIFMYGKPTFTLALLIVIFSIYFFMEQVGSSTSTRTLVSLGAKFDPLIIEGEWWRFFSAMFLHIGFLHLFMNSLALFYLGSAVERIFGSARFVFIYFTAGFFGSISSFVFNDNISAGASGAIFGLFGALLYFGARNKKLFFRTFGSSVVIILGINLAFGFLVPMVDNGAHIGGLIGGFAASAIIGLPERKYLKSQPLAGIGAVLAALILLLAGFTQNVESSQLQTIYYELGRESIEENDYEDAESYLVRAVDIEGDESGPVSDEEIQANSYFLLSYAQLQRERYEEAEENLSTAIELRTDFHEAYYNLAILQYERGNYEEALEAINSALEITGESDYEDLRNEIIENAPDNS